MWGWSTPPGLSHVCEYSGPEDPRPGRRAGPDPARSSPAVGGFPTVEPTPARVGPPPGERPGRDARPGKRASGTRARSGPAMPPRRAPGAQRRRRPAAQEGRGGQAPAPCPSRRRTLQTRATSSSGETGLGTKSSAPSFRPHARSWASPRGGNDGASSSHHGGANSSRRSQAVAVCRAAPCRTAIPTEAHLLQGADDHRISG